MRTFLLLAALTLPSAALAQTYQYGVLYINKATGYAWETPNGVVGPDTSLRSFANKLRCRGETLGAIMNCLGADGWELVTSYADPTRAQGVQALLFKRGR